MALRLRPVAANSPAPRGALLRVCGLDGCDAPHPTTSDLTLQLVLRAVDAAANVTWSSAQAPGLSALPSVRFSSLVFLTVPASRLPVTLPSMTIVANMTRNGASGIATVTVPLNSAPMCSEPAGCCGLAMQSSAFPDAAAYVSAQGWTDANTDASQLRFEFGIRPGGGCVSETRVVLFCLTTHAPLRPLCRLPLPYVTAAATCFVHLLRSAPDRIQYVGAQPAALIVGLPVGASTLYCCAVDAYGAKSCGTANATVTPPPANFDASSALANATSLAAVRVATLAGIAHKLESPCEGSLPNAAVPFKARAAPISACALACTCMCMHLHLHVHPSPHVHLRRHRAPRCLPLALCAGR
jgi:hypothetical protein